MIAALTVFVPAYVQGQQARLAYDRGDTEINAFLAARSASPRTLAPEEAGLDTVKIPVLAFDAVPGLVQRSIAPGVAPQRERSFVTNPADPVWYAIEDDYGDITVTVKADARISHAFPENYPLARDAGSPSAAPRINVMDETVEQGLEGVIVEYTLYKFPNIPYTVTIECAAHLREQCRDLGLLTQDKDGLRLIAVPSE